MNWLSDQDRNLLAPKTLVEAVQNVKSKSLEELLESSGNVPQYEYSTEKIVGTQKDGVVNLATNLTYTDCVLVIQYTKTTD